MISTVDTTSTAGLPLTGRAELMATIAARIRAASDELVTAAQRAFPFPGHVIRADIELAATRLETLDVLIDGLAERRPIGTVALALPGNAVLSNPIGTIGAAVLAGNQVTVRLPARRRDWSNILADLLRDLDTVRFSSLGGREFVDRALRDPGVAAVMMFGDDRWATGYEATVRRTRTRFVFEGPGNDPFLVLDPATVERAAAAAVRSGFYNAGQACTAAERCYVVSSCHDEFVARVVDLVDRLRVGDPADQDTEIGPLAPEVADRVTRQVADAVRKGARLLRSAGPRRVTARGMLVSPIVLTGVDHSMAVMRDETYGPVLAIQRVESAAEAVELAGDNRYGLSATVFGGTDAVHRELERGHGRVYADETWLEHRRRDPHAPYGGRRSSGWVWERRGHEFIRRDGPRHNTVEFSLPGKYAQRNG
jgi:acyl-CoA reductase-like NAD-dependent aldehyde dehydrogenase